MNIQLSDHFTYRRLIRFTISTVLMLICTSMYSIVAVSYTHLDKIKKTDRERKLYYEARTGREWGGIESNSMMFNTSLLGIDGAVDALEAIYRKWDAGRDVES